MKKIYFFESNPEPKIWEKIIDNVEGEIIHDIPWKISERRIDDSQKNMSESSQNRILEMVG